jgi:hypothetical protein
VKLAVSEENGDVLLEPGDDVHLINSEAVA